MPPLPDDIAPDPPLPDPELPDRPPIPPRKPPRPPVALADTSPGSDFGGGASTHDPHGPQLPPLGDFASMRQVREPRLPALSQSHKPDEPGVHDSPVNIAPAAICPPLPLMLAFFAGA
jgi:hypothetical protein